MGPLYRLLMLAARPYSTMGPPNLLLMLLPGTSICPWAPVPPLHAARPGPKCVLGRGLRPRHCCCQDRNLPWAPRTDSSCCCAETVNCAWAPESASSCCCQVQSECLRVPVTASPLFCWP
ncbi:unnamed protein product, partial [Staurois parvus]